MSLTEELSLIKRKRQGLRIWIIEHETTFKALADTLGIKAPTLDAHLNNAIMPVEHHNKLVQVCHVPPSLLPVPQNVRPGRKAKVPYSATQ